MRTITTNLYQFDELSDKAKDKARDWYREASAGDNFFAEAVTDDFKEVLKACGFSLNTRRGSGDALYWSLGYSQSDGASFGASWQASAVDVAAMRADRPAEYTDADGKVRPCKSNQRTLALLDSFEALKLNYPGAYGSTDASSRGSYQVDTTASSDDESLIEGTLEELASDFEACCRDLAHAYYQALREEHEYQNSDESIDENIRANEYEFTAEGERS